MDKYFKIVQNMSQIYILTKPIFNQKGNLSDLAIIEVNNAFHLKLNKSGSNITNESVLELIFNNDKKWIDKLKKSYENEDLVEHEQLLDYKEHLYTVATFLNEDKHLVILMHQKENDQKLKKDFITKEQEILNKLKISDQRYKGFFEHAPISIVFYEVINDGSTVNDYIIKKANPMSIKTEGWDPLKVIGKPLGEVKPGVDEFVILEGLFKTFKTGEVTYLPVRIYEDETTKKWFDNSIYKIGKNELVVLYRDKTDEIEKEKRIEALSYKDALSGLYNRHYFQEKYGLFTSKEVLPLTIIIGDLSGLKIINDAFGHDIGDKAIIKSAEILKETVDEEYIFRWGGDEFLILLPNTTQEKADEVIKEINRKFNQTKIENIQLSIALGCACKATIHEDFFEYLKIAEHKMYKNKFLANETQKGNILKSIKQTLFQKNQDIKFQGPRIAKFTNEIGKHYRLSEEKLNDLELLSMLHNIGKITIDSEILEKPSPLTEKEWQIIKTHPEVGYRIASAIPELRDIAGFILSHHERWDGLGYPHGLKANEIPLLSRILSVVDAYDAMVNTRPYREELSKEAAIKELKQNSGTQFDPDVTEVFINILQTKKIR